MADVFVSQSRKDTDFVRKLQNALQAQKRNAWVDWKDIPLTASGSRKSSPTLKPRTISSS